MNCLRQANQANRQDFLPLAEFRPLDAGGKWNSADSRCLASPASLF